MEDKKLILDVNEKPKPLQWFLLSFQHVFAMFGATVLVPLLVNEAVGQEVLSISVTLVCAGIGTFIYALCTKFKSPVFLGSSFAFINPMVAVAAGAIASGASSPKDAVFTGIMAVGIVYVIMSFLIKAMGKGWIDKILPPVVIGPMIAIIGLSLAPTAVNQMGLANESVNFSRLSIAVVAMLVTAVCAIKAKGFLKVIPFLIGIAAGYFWSILLSILGWIDPIDFSAVLNTAWFSIPNFYVPFVSYQLDFQGVMTIAPLAVVTAAEHIGDHTVLGAIMGRNLLKDPGLDRTILGDGLATFVAGMLGGPANTTYGENTSVVGMTKVGSVYVVLGAAFISICLGFLGKFSAIINTIPTEVFGGVCLLLYGFIASNGLRVLVDHQVDFSKTSNVVVVSTMLVLGLGNASIKLSILGASITLTGMVLAAIVGICLNLVFNKAEK